MDDENNLEMMCGNLNIKYLNNLINGCYKINMNCENIKMKLDKLNNDMIDIENYSITEQKNKLVTEMAGKSVTETETIEYLYLKPWSKLTQIHKVIKIKEFVSGLDISNDNDKETLKDKIIGQIKEKKAKNKINYDDMKGKILSISNLSFDNNEYVLS